MSWTRSYAKQTPAAVGKYRHTAYWHKQEEEDGELRQQGGNAGAVSESRNKSKNEYMRENINIKNTLTD